MYNSPSQHIGEENSYDHLSSSKNGVWYNPIHIYDKKYQS